MSGSFGTLNTKYNILLNELRNASTGGAPAPPGPTSSTLADVMLNGNSVGGSDLDMNAQNIINVANINGLPYPPADPTLQEVLTAGASSTISIFIKDSLVAPTAFAKIDDIGVQVSSNPLTSSTLTSTTLNYTDGITPISATTEDIINKANEGPYAIPNIAEVLLAGNNVGPSSIDMNGQSITALGLTLPLTADAISLTTTGNDITLTSGNAVTVFGDGGVTLDANGNALTIGNGGADNVSINGTDSIDLNAGNQINLNPTGNFNLSGGAIIGIETLTDEININCGTNMGLSAALGNINLDTPNGHVIINGSQYPPTLSAVLTAGNTATNSITLNNTGTGTNVINLLPNASASNPQITLTDGTTTNTIDKNGYTTRNTAANLSHYLNFSDSSSTGTGAIQKTAGISCNPSTNTVTATTFNGNATSATGVALTSDNTSGTYYIPFSKTTTATGNALYIDNTTGPLTYNPSANTLTLGTGTSTNAVSSSSMNMTSGTSTFNQSVANWRMATSASLYTNINPSGCTILNGTSNTTLDTATGCRVTGPTTTSQLTSGNMTISNTTGTVSTTTSTTQYQANNNGIDISTLSNFRLTLNNNTNSTSCDFQNSGRGFLTGNGVGYNSTPSMTITNNLATVGATTGVPSVLYSKTGRNAVAGDVIASQHFYANDFAGTSTEFARIEASVRNTGVGNDDGSIAFSGLINGVMTEFFRINGADSENNMFLPVDMNGQAIKSSSGNLGISTASSSGTGTITLTPKPLGNLIFQNLPTSVVGLPSGAVWNNLGVLSIAP